jgi:hypothetical protein
LPAGPIEFADGHVTISGDVAAGWGSDDDGAYFNYTDYNHSALRLLRVDLMASAKANDHLALLAEIRTENVDSLEPYALYVRVRPWTDHDFDVQVGRIPPTFGAFARRTYPLRPDSLPASADELLLRRGRGWLDRFTIGDTTLQHGVPLVTAFRWDTGVQVHAATASGVIGGAVAVTSGTLSNPRVADDNSGRQWAGRVELRPVTGLIVGSSAAWGAWVTNTAAQAAAGENNTGQFSQAAWGADVEYSRDHYLLRNETIVSAWRLPIVNRPDLPQPLRSFSTSFEGRYKIVPGLYAAARVEHLGFSEVTGTTATLPWDAPVTRVEAGPGMSLQRNLLLKLAYQYNRRDGGPFAAQRHELAFQLVYWF